ncbi:MAG: 50S ribosomal protein L18 [Oscillospiraceae bacterium]|nr:50S ribosomal protein L18 [Oscillospiraceae bacterium]
MIRKPVSNVARQKRHLRVRKKVSGTQERPRLNVFRSLNQIYAQVIDDTRGHTLVSASTLEKGTLPDGAYGGNKEAAKAVGASIARKAIEKGITKVVFDRGGYLFSGRVKELAEAARAGGLEF